MFLTKKENNKSFTAINPMIPPVYDYLFSTQMDNIKSRVPEFYAMF
jgi:hypothetical protein